MTGLLVADSTGLYRTAKGLWVADGTGTYKAAKNGYVADGTGAYRLGYNPAPALSSFAVAKGSPSYQKVSITWASSVAAGGYKLYQAGVTAPIYTGAATSFVFTGVPNTKYSFYLRAYDADGVTYTQSATVSITTDVLAAPANFRKTNGDYASTQWAWNAVAGATGYDLLDTLSANAVKWSGTTTSVSEYPLSSSTTYERAIRAKLGGALSSPSNKVRYTTPAPPGPAAGTYTYGANTQTAAWAPGYGIWRPSSDGVVHGNGDNWGGGNGNNGTLFFYGNRPWHALAGGRVTRFKIHLRRDSSAGLSSAQACEFGLHNYVNRPGGQPTGLSFGVSAGSLAWGQDAWIDLPISWGQDLVDNSTWAGIWWGFVSGRYMRGLGPGALNTQGALALTIG